MTGRIHPFASAAASVFHQALPDLATCEAIGGRFNLERLEERSLRVPAVLVGILKSPLKLEADGSVTVSANCAAFIVTEGRETERDAQAWTIAEALAALLGSARTWGVAGVGMVTNADIEPVISGQTRNKGVTLIAVTWTVPIRRIGTSLFDDDGHVPTDLYVNGVLEDTHDGGDDAG